MISKEGYNKNVNFMTPMAGVFVLGRIYLPGLYIIIKIILMTCINMYQHIDCYCIKGLQSSFPRSLHFIYYFRGMWIGKYETRNKKSVSKVTQLGDP